MEILDVSCLCDIIQLICIVCVTSDDFEGVGNYNLAKGHGTWTWGKLVLI